MEEQIKKIQEELELVKKERDKLILEKSKTFIKSRLNNSISGYRNSEIRKELVNKNYISAMYRTYETELLQTLIDDYGYDLVVECMIECFKGDDSENEI